MSDATDKPVSAQSVREALRDFFPPPEWALVSEVANGTEATTRRWADAIAMNLWPSRGLAIHGVEIKVSRSDWKRELQKPEKAEEVHQNCDFWWVAAKKAVVEPHELPPGWGLLEYQTHGRRAGKLAVVTPATKQERAGPVSRSFVAALLRAHTRSEDAERSAEISKQVRELADRRIASERSQWEREVSYKMERTRKLSEILSDEEIRWLEVEAVQRALRFVLKAGLSSSYTGIGGIVDSLKRAEENTADLRRRIEQLAPELLPDAEGEGGALLTSFRGGLPRKVAA